MTKDKARKRATRARMTKTGESYTAARRHIPRSKNDFIAGDMPASDAAMRKNTGKGWKEWLRVLDEWGAKERKHGEITKYLMDEHAVPGWWAQSVTVGFERARGMRAKYQTASGFSVSVSKTFPVAIGTMFKAFSEAPQRNKWLEKGTLKVRTSQRNKSIRFDHEDGSTRVNAYFQAKGRTKTTVTVEHARLPESAWVEKMRATWKERLSDLSDVIEH